MSEHGYWDKIVNRRVSRRRAITATGALAASAAFLAACGGDDDDDDGGTSGTSGGGGTTSGGGGTGGGAPSGGTVKTGGTLRKDMVAEDPAHFDLHQAASFLITEPFNLCYNQLVRFSEKEGQLGVIEPDLATAWEQPDDLTLTFTVREATFQDGTPFTSADVKATLELVKDPPEGINSLRSSWLEPIDTIETPDDRTAVLHLNRPSAFMFNSLGAQTMAIYAGKDIAADPHFHETNVNGTGPFLKDEIQQGSLYAFNKNPDYWDEGKPYLDRIEFNIIPEAVARFAAWKGGNLDAYSPQAAEVAEIEGISDASYVKNGGTAYWVMTVPTQRDPWKDQRLWTAIALSVNKDDFNQAQFLGTSAFSGGMPPGSEWGLSEEELLQVPGYKGIGDGQESDMDARWAEAKKLFSAANFDTSRKIELFSWELAPFQVWMEVILDGLRNAGIENTNLTLVDRGTYDERLANRDWGDLAGNSRNAAIPDPTPVYADNYLTTSGRHYSDLVIPEVEDLWAKQEATLDAQKRQDLVNQMIKAFLSVWQLDISVYTVHNYALWNYVKDWGPIYGSNYQGDKHDAVWLDNA
jgi:peptide/nickel transport system substrate-binding protein